MVSFICILLWIIGSAHGFTYFGVLGVDIFSEAYDSGNFVKFIVSVFFFIMIPISSGALGWLLMVIYDNVKKEK